MIAQGAADAMIHRVGCAPFSAVRIVGRAIYKRKG
ncbi:hypothetical protein GTHT12_00552 [Geobacillus thermodenitrificans]|jgi:hypothetical protein|nr:hypothetical protein GTHT12_00552 [Geobacillus thermodenitrificans]KQB93997.1 hypothetical protein GEPA3_1045 [Geobacillus sp. PA-3]MEC5188480.1 hypothetical protein [Geobacillus thermodenitrificans]